MEVRILTEADAQAFWNIRLRALRDNPESFGASYEEILERGLILRPKRGNQPRRLSRGRDPVAGLAASR